MRNEDFSAAAVYPECNIIWSGFPNNSIQHCSREAYQTTHELVRRAMQTKDICIWNDKLPSIILEFLINDVTILDQ